MVIVWVTGCIFHILYHDGWGWIHMLHPYYSGPDNMLLSVTYREIHVNLGLIFMFLSDKLIGDNILLPL